MVSLNTLIKININIMGISKLEEKKYHENNKLSGNIYKDFTLPWDRGGGSFAIMVF